MMTAVLLLLHYSHTIYVFLSNLFFWSPVIADDDLVSDKVSDWSKYFDSIFKKVELADIEAFEKEYIGRLVVSGIFKREQLYEIQNLRIQENNK